MTREMQEEWLALYLELIDGADEMERQGFSQKAALYNAQAEGMRNSLEILGYEIREQYNESLKGNEIYIAKG